MTVATFELRQHMKSEPFIPLWLKPAFHNLRQKFLTEATVIDSQTGFISAPFMNKANHIDSHMLKTQAEILAWNFRFSFPTHVIGIPESGLPLAREVAKLFPWAAYVQSQKETAGATPLWDWARGETFSVYSFTRKQNMIMHTEPIRPGCRYLVVDDVIAKGNAGKEYLRAIRQRGGILVGLAAGWDKQFQGGLDAIAQEHRIKVASTISVTAMLPDNHVEIAGL